MAKTFKNLLQAYDFETWHEASGNTLKKSYKRPPHIFSSSSESKLRSIKIHDQINKPMSNSGSESVCIPTCVVCVTQSKHE